MYSDTYVDVSGLSPRYPLTLEPSLLRNLQNSHTLAYTCEISWYTKQKDHVYPWKQEERFNWAWDTQIDPSLLLQTQEQPLMLTNGC